MGVLERSNSILTHIFGINFFVPTQFTFYRRTDRKGSRNAFISRTYGKEEMKNKRFIFMDNFHSVIRPQLGKAKFDVNCVDKVQRNATVCRYLFTASLLYMFRASIAPIISSTEKCNRSFRYRSLQGPSSNVA